MPSGWAPDGCPVLGKRAPDDDWYWSKWYGEIHGANTAMTTNTTTIAMPR